ncbi:MAG TPA: SDR family NAD(P)-dependent oxidoreductase, partial [Pyrinomonadaceae bacterium]|nr:SDR family NAD(P)-dependent oxidoreductase [Pyrinomonadaceae bacterium]
AQYVQMGRGLYEKEPTFRTEFDHCAELLLPELGLDLRQLLYPEADGEAEATERLKQTQLTQPALFALEYSLAKLWMKWGVQPSAMIGHSIGEYVAACLAGVFSLEEALSLVAERGRLMQSLPSGSMLTVPLAAQDTELLLGQNGFAGVSVAAINAAALTVVSGPSEAIEHFESELVGKGLACRRLHTSHAFHSSMMDPILEPFKNRVRQTKPKAPAIPFVSNLTGRWITEAEAMDPEYWANHLRHAVRFTDGLEELTGQGQRIFLEVGPGQTLSTLAKQYFARGNKQPVFSSLRHPQETQSDLSFLLNTLGRLWTEGTTIDWASFHAEERRQRVPLPTYPFERRRYWVSAPKDSQAAPSLLAQLTKRLALADWTFVPSWKRLPLSPQSTLAVGRSWLLFLDDCQVGSKLAETLSAKGHEVVVVRPGEKFSRIAAGQYEIDPGQPADYAALVKELLAADNMPRRVVHLWGVSDAKRDFNAWQDLGFYSLLSLTQALGEHDITTPLSLWVVTNNLQDVNGSEDLQPEKATILGICKVIPQEYQNINCRCLDVQTTGPGEMLLEQLLAELNADSAEPFAAYRGAYRWVPAFEPVRLDDRNDAPLRLRQNGTYLITGGMGGIGLVLAEHLARTVQAHLILVGRSSFPERSEWDAWLGSHSDDDSVSRKIRKLQELESLGGAVLVLSADVSQLEEMRAVVAKGQEGFGEIHGVIHAAGIAGGGIIQYKTREVADNVMRPKVGGALVLDQIFSGTKLDFFVLCSSLASIAGGFGQVDYCAANSFLDVFAQRNQRRNSTFTTAINWDVWGEVGMAVDTEVPADMKARRLEELKNGISTAEGLAVFDRILASDLPQVAVATRDLRAIMTQLSHAEATTDVSSEPEQVVLYPRPELSNEFVAPTNEVEEIIARIWAELLGVEQVGIHDNFFDLGGHSLLGTQLLSRLQQKFQVEIPLRTLFETQTVAGLAEIISRMQQENESEEAKLLKMIEALADDQVDELLK